MKIELFPPKFETDEDVEKSVITVAVCIVFCCLFIFAVPSCVEERMEEDRIKLEIHREGIPQLEADIRELKNTLKTVIQVKGSK